MNKPYYQDDLVTLYHCKAEDFLGSQTDTIDLVLTDPPYGIGESGGKSKSRGKLANADRYTHYEWDNETPNAIVENVILMPWYKYKIIWGGNFFEMPASSAWIVWDKNNGKNDFADCELAWTNLPGAVRKIEWTWNGMLKQEKEYRFHPTQKPEAVMGFCLDLYINKFGKPNMVLDPFAGSSTTLIACRKRGIKCIGVEMIEEYCEKSAQRLSQMTLV